MIKQWTNLTGLIIFASIFLGVLVLDIVIVYSYYTYVHQFIQDQPVEFEADAGVVFFGDYDKDQEQLGADSKLRALAAAELFREGKIKELI